MKPIKSIEEELADCRQAFAEHPDAKTVWCCHHEVLVEELTDPFEARISYILSDKPEEERAVRFRNFRPVKNEATIARPYKDYKTATEKTRADYIAATIARPYKDFSAAIATAQAWKDYRAAVSKTWEAYYAATAKAVEVYDAAIKLVEKPLVDLLNQEWPDHTWNEGSIFKDKNS